MEVGSFVRIIKTAEIAEVFQINKDKLTVIIDGEYEKTVKEREVEYIPPIHLSEADLKNIFRLNKEYMDCYEDIRLATNYSYEKPYQPTIDDLLAMVANFKIKKITVGQFLSALFEINIILKPCYLPQEDISEKEIENLLLAKQSDLFKYVFELFDVNAFNGEEAIEDHFDIEEVISMISLFRRDSELSLEKREYVESIKESFISYVQDNDLIDEVEPPYDEMFVRFTKELAAQNNPIGLETLGYCYYGGNSLFECDWEKCRDIFEKLYSQYGEPGIANSLGYIYYFGRANNGIGEYDKAFKYFSIGAASGIYESRYKLADMFRHGYYFTKNNRVAEEIYTDLYQENLKIFSKGFLDCKFADLALRMGGIFAEKQQWPAAYYFYLQADFAIRERMSNYDYYGDQRVFDGVIEGLECCRRNQHFETAKHADMENLDILNLFFEGHRRVHFKVKALKVNKLKMTARILPERDGLQPYCLITMLSFNGCMLTDELTFTALDVQNWQGDFDFVATSIDYEYNVVRFYNNDDLAFAIDCYGFRVANPFKDPHKDERRFIQVKIKDETRDYYFCQLKNVQKC